MGIGRGGPEIRFAVAAIFGDVNMPTGVDVKLQMLSMHSARRTEVPLDLSTGSRDAARIALGACSYHQAGRFLLGAIHKESSIPLQRQVLGEAVLEGGVGVFPLDFTCLF